MSSSIKKDVSLYDSIETSTSFFTQDSEDSTVMFSARGSAITEDDVGIRNPIL